MTLFTRLTYNENDWEIPSGHLWSVTNQNNPNIAYENQHGFGHEEWLFNPRYNIAGWQYGYIRGLSRVHQDIQRVYLYTVRKVNGQKLVYYLGYLNNVEVLNEDWDEMFPEASQAYKDYFLSTITEVQQINGNSTVLHNDSLRPVIRFRTEDSESLDTPELVPLFPLHRYKRFQPYQITDEILELFENGTEVYDSTSFIFNPGKASQTERFNRYVGASSKSVLKTHSRIIDQLEQYLGSNYSVKRKNLSIEKTRFNGNIADLVTLEADNSISIYEVKTSLNLRKNIREAIAQLLDYSSHSNGTKIRKLVIVSPCELDNRGEEFLESLNSLVQLDIFYMQYQEGGKTGFISNE